MTKPAKEGYLSRIGAEMEKYLSAGEWSLRQKLALACRSLARGGHARGLAVTTGRAARLHLPARYAGKIKTMDPEPANEAHDCRHRQRHVEASFGCYARQVLREAPECLE